MSRQEVRETFAAMSDKGLVEVMQRVVSAPEDDEPRLAFANSVEERAPARAAFIRWQCALAQHDHLQDAYAYDLGQLIRNAITPPPREIVGSADFGQKVLSHGLSITSTELDDDWVTGAVRDAVHACTFRRGFIEGVYIDAASLLSNAEALFAAAPITHLTLDAPPEWERTESAVALLEKVLALPQMSQVKSLALGAAFGDPCAVAIAGCSHLDGLTHLSFGQNNKVTKVGVEALANSPHLAQLSSLDLSRCKLGAAGLEVLLAGPLSSRLQRLVLRDCRAGGKALLALTKATLPTLTHLDLGGNALSAASLKRLPKAEWAAQLETLSLRGNAVGGELLEVVAGGPFLKVRSLDLAFARLAEGELKDLAGADLWTDLEELDLEFNSIGDQDVAAIFGAQFGAALRSLNLDQCNRLSEAAMAHIADSPRAARLAQLAISGAGEACAEPIAGSPNLSDLRSLRIQSKGKWREDAVQTVLASPGLRGLQVLLAPGARVLRRDTVTEPVTPPSPV